MYVRQVKKKKGSKEYFYYVVAETNRENGQVKQKMIAHLGAFPSKEAAIEAAIEQGYPVGHYTKKAKTKPDYIKRLESFEGAYHSGDDDKSMKASMAIGAFYDSLSREQQEHARTSFGVVMNMLSNRESDGWFRANAGYYNH
jgi:hypothetical protein